MTRPTREETANRIRRVWSYGDTQTMLAEKLGVTASAISGMYRRNPELKNTHPLGGNVGRNAADPSPEPRPGPNAYIQRASRIEAKRAIHDTPAPEVSDKPGRYTMLTLPDNGCKWPHGDRQITFCGCTREPGRPYCPTHARQSFGGYAITRKVQERRR